MVNINWTNNYTSTDPNKQTKMNSHDRVFVLKADGDPKTTKGLTDKRLFTGDNKIHAIRDEGSTFLWYFKFEHGVLPNELQGKRYTKFDLAKSDLERYFNSRNVIIEEVIT